MYPKLINQHTFINTHRQEHKCKMTHIHTLCTKRDKDTVIETNKKHTKTYNKIQQKPQTHIHKHTQSPTHTHKGKDRHTYIYVDIYIQMHKEDRKERAIDKNKKHTHTHTHTYTNKIQQKTLIHAYKHAQSHLKTRKNKEWKDKQQQMENTVLSCKK